MRDKRKGRKEERRKTEMRKERYGEKRERDKCTLPLLICQFPPTYSYIAHMCAFFLLLLHVCPLGTSTNSNHQWMEGGLFCVLLRFPSWVPRLLGSYFRGLRVAVVSYNVGGCSPLITIISPNNNGLDLA